MRLNGEQQISFALIALCETKTFGTAFMAVGGGVEPPRGS